MYSTIYKRNTYVRKKYIAMLTTSLHLHTCTHQSKHTAANTWTLHIQPTCCTSNQHAAQHSLVCVCCTHGTADLVRGQKANGPLCQPHKHLACLHLLYALVLWACV